MLKVNKLGIFAWSKQKHPAVLVAYWKALLFKLTSRGFKTVNSLTTFI